MGIAVGVHTTTDGEDARTSRIFPRPIGSSLPFGMAALAGASIMLTGYQLGLAARDPGTARCCRRCGGEAAAGPSTTASPPRPATSRAKPAYGSSSEETSQE